MERMRIDQKFRAHWKQYIFQSFLATVVMFIILIVLKLQNAVITASIGATAFIIFTMPDYRRPAKRDRRTYAGFFIRGGLLPDSPFIMG